jgi:glutathione S-transferase
MPPMAVLFDNDWSGNCYKVRLLASQLGLPLERRQMDVVDRSNRAEVLGGLNPALRVPTLVFDDGRSLPESNAIIFYLAEGTEYLPEGHFERAQVLQWMFFEQYDLEPNIAVARFWKLAGIDADPGLLQSKIEAGTRTLNAIDAHLSERTYLVAERYTIADICVYAYTHVADEGGFDLAAYPAINAWIQRIEAQPGYIPITA